MMLPLLVLRLRPPRLLLLLLLLLLLPSRLLGDVPSPRPLQIA
jgi:hypothetical protein